MKAFFMFFLLRLLQNCAGCAGTCAGFVQGLSFEKLLKIKELKRLVQGVHGLVKIALCVRAGAGARVRQCARTDIFQKPCTPCTGRYNLLKKREKDIFKPCTNPAHYPAHLAQI